MHMLVSVKYMPTMGWHGAEHIAHASMTADASELTVAINASGEASAAWIETDSAGSKVITSHMISTNSAWSQKESVKSIAAFADSGRA